MTWERDNQTPLTIKLSPDLNIRTHTYTHTLALLLQNSSLQSMNTIQTVQQVTKGPRFYKGQCFFGVRLSYLYFWSYYNYK